MSSDRNSKDWSVECDKMLQFAQGWVEFLTGLKELQTWKHETDAEREQWVSEQATLKAETESFRAERDQIESDLMALRKTFESESARCNELLSRYEEVKKNIGL